MQVYAAEELNNRGYSYDEILIILKEMINEGCINLAKNHLVTNLISIYVGYENEGIAHASNKILITTNLYSLFTLSSILNPPI